MGESTSSPLIGAADLALFRISDPRDRADRLRDDLTPKVVALLEAACEQIGEAYGMATLESFRISRTPAHRKGAKRTQEFDLASAGLIPKGDHWYLQQRIECRSSGLNVVTFGLRGLEANSIVEILQKYKRQVVSLLNCSDFKIISQSIDPRPNEILEFSEFIDRLTHQPQGEWRGTRIKGGLIPIPILDTGSAGRILDDFVALFSIFLAVADLRQGREERVLAYLDRYYRWAALRPSPPRPATPAQDPSGAEARDQEEVGKEGGSVSAMRRHRHREKRLRRRKIERALEQGRGRLCCEVPGCGFDFFEVYGDIGKEYAHVHHTNPLSERPERITTRLSELAIVCANCHAMIHRGRSCRPLLGLIQRGSNP